MAKTSKKKPQGNTPVSSILDSMEFTFQIKTPDGPVEKKYTLEDPAALSKILAIVQTYGAEVTE